MPHPTRDLVLVPVLPSTHSFIQQILIECPVSEPRGGAEGCSAEDDQNLPAKPPPGRRDRHHQGTRTQTRGTRA